MAKTLRQIRRQIRLVGKIHQITRAMQMVAAAKLRRVQQRVIEGRTYWQRMQEIVQEVSSGVSGVEHPLLTPRSVERIGLFVIAANKGLCGAYTAQVTREAIRFIQRQQHPVVVRLSGQKARNPLQRAGYPVEAELPRDDKTLAQDARHIAQNLRQWYEQGHVDEVHLCYAQFISSSRDNPMTMRLLPVTAPATDQRHGAPSEYLFEPSPAELFTRLLPRYVDVQVYQILLEASASEHAARMRAMATAMENAEKMTEKLTMQANRLRQQEITEELLDVVGGAEALA